VNPEIRRKGTMQHKNERLTTKIWKGIE